MTKISFCQDSQNIKFLVLDTYGKTNVEGASIYIYRDSTIISQQTTDQFGQASIKLNTQDPYLIKVSHIAYEFKELNVSPNDYKNGLTILLQKKSNLLDSITITGSNIRYEPDKTSYLVNQKLFSANHNSLDVLKKVPGISVINSEVRVLGQKNIAYFYNGKEVDFDFVKLLQAKNIKKIEVKDQNVRYKEGQFVIIDIISNTLLDGYAVTVGQSIGTRNRATSQMSAKIKRKQLVVDANLQFHTYKNEGSHSSNIEFPDKKNEILYDGDRTAHFKNLILSSNIGYEIDSMNNLNLYLNKVYNPTKNNIITNQINQGSIKTLWSDSKSELDQLTANLEYKKKFNKNSELTSSIYFRNEKQIDSFQITQDTVIRNKSILDKKDLILQVDYTNKVGSLFSYNIGSKYVHRNNNNRFSYDTDFEQQKQQEDIFYVQTEGILKNRLVNVVTSINMEFYTGNIQTNNEESRKINYNNLLYSIIFSRNLSTKNSLRLNISRVIYRPSINMLSRFYNEQDINTIKIGNDKLKPEIQNIFRLSYNTTFSIFDLNISNTFKITSDEMNPFFSEKDNLTIREFINIDKKLTYRPSIDLSFSKGNLYNQFGLSYDLFKFKGIDHLISNPSKPFNSLAMNYSAGYNFKHKWALEANVMYESGINSFQTKMKGYIYADISISKEIKKFRVSLEYIDAFNRSSNFINTLYLSKKYHQQTLYNSNIIRAKIAYSFGKDFNVRNSRNIKNDDIKNIN